MHYALHPRNDEVRPHVLRKDIGRGFASIERSVDVSIRQFKDFIKKREDWL